MKTLKFLLFFFIFKLLLLISPSVYANDFKTDYLVEYDLSNFRQTLISKVKFNIKITNLKSDVYVNKFFISFPKSFTISNLQSADDRGQIKPKVTSDKFNTKVEMEFSNPNIGRNTVNNFYLIFEQSNLFQQNGKIWEVVLPVIENRHEGEYRVVVVLPSDTDKKISIAKPKPDQIVGNKITWINPEEKTIYAVFGDSQIYKAELSYHLKNTEVVPVITEVSFPPDTLYQKLFIESINPSPNSTYQDSDGNFMAKYYLKPMETKTVTFKGFIQVFTSAREEIKPLISKRIQSQKNYLLSSQKYWSINSLDKINTIKKDVKDIYSFVVGYLKYNFNKINVDNLRLGAEGVLLRPNQAVCMEFTDLFIGISREKGILTREIEGYGISFDPRLQPISLASDVLHAWPEYFDEVKGIWIPVDPTWENTSGIDYFSSFDLNHIVFAIHGKKSDYPLPAGMYKFGNSKDISIKAAMETPSEKKSLAFKNIGITSKIFENKEYQGKFLVINNSNTYLYNVPLETRGMNIVLNKSKTIIDSLAPFESKEISFLYQSEKNQRQGKIIISAYGQKLREETIGIVPRYYLILLGTGGMIVFILGSFLVFKRIKSK